MKIKDFLNGQIAIIALLFFVFVSFIAVFKFHDFKIVSVLKDFSKTQTGAVFSAVTNPIIPYYEWTADDGSPTSDTQNNFDLICASGPCPSGMYQTGLNGPVSNYINFSSTANDCSGGGCLGIAGNRVNAGITGSFAVEFLIKPGRDFYNVEFLNANDYAFGVNFSFLKSGETASYMSFYTNTGTSGNVLVDDFVISLNKSGPMSPSYYLDGNWHHFAFSYNSSTGVKEIWIDGKLPNGFSKTLTNPGNLFGNGGNDTIYFNSSQKYRVMNGGVDEMRIYNTYVPGNLFYQHFLDFQTGQHFSPTTMITNVPDAPSINLTGLDPLNYAPGANLSTVIPYTTGITETLLEQIQSYPLPRYKTNTTLNRNFPWVAFDFQSQDIPGIPYVQNISTVNNAKNIALELAKKWNYYLMPSTGIGATDFSDKVGTFHGALADQASLHPELPRGIVVFSESLAIMNQNLPNNHYLQKSNGDFINPLTGNVTVEKVWRPSVLALPTSYVNPNTGIMSGIAVHDEMTPLLDALNNTDVGPKINMIALDDEFWPEHYSNSALAKDPVVTSEKNASNLDWQSFVAETWQDFMHAYYIDPVMNRPELVGAKFSVYKFDGYGDFSFKWSKARKINTPINNKYYASISFYPRFIDNWRSFYSAWHGWNWVSKAIQDQISIGDKYCSPYISPGYNPNETGNITPGSWLGILKSLANTCAEFFYTAYFHNADGYVIGDPRSYAWQEAVPSYAQAIFSKIDSLYKASDLMQGDMPLDRDNLSDTRPGYMFSSGDPRVLVTVRKSTNSNKYIITTSLTPYSNENGNTELSKDISIKLDGNNISFETRRQGSVYVFDNTNQASPVFYQVDKWHDWKHPSYWNKTDFNFEAELYDSSTTTPILKTEGPGIPTKNFTSGMYDTIISQTSGTTSYNFEYRDNSGSGTTTPLYVWYRARSSNGNAVSGAIKIDSQTQKNISVSYNNYGWCNKDSSGAVISFSGVSENTNHLLKYVASSPYLYLDQLIVTTNPNLGLGNCTNGSGTPDTIDPNVTLVSPVNNAVISGNSYVLAAVASDNYAVSSVQFYLDNSPIQGAVDISGDNPNVNQTGIPGFLYEAVLDTTIISTGIHTISALVTDFSSNTKMSTIAIVNVNNVGGNIDLIVQDIGLNINSPVAGNKIIFKAKIKNKGTIATPIGLIGSGPHQGEQYRTRVLFHLDGAPIYWNDNYTQSIPPGGVVWISATAGTNGNKWTAVSGNHTITATVDDTNIFLESNENNNLRTESLIIP